MKQMAVSLLIHLYTWLLRLYPSGFRDEFEDEMRSVFNDVLADVKIDSWSNTMILFAHELRDLPGSLWRAHLDTRRKFQMNQNLTWRPPTTKELFAGFMLFVMPVLPSLLKLVFGYQPLINQISSKITVALLTIILIVLVLGIIHGFPRWAVPYLGVAITSIVILEPSWRIWGLFYSDVQRAIGYYTKTLQVRVLYQTLMWGFFWFLVFVAITLLILLLMAWPRTRHLVKNIRQDWTLFSFTLYGGVVFTLELVFEEYAYDELWKVACRVCLALGAWIYFKNADHRKRILALLVGVTLTYWIAAIGKWYLVPLQAWGAWFGYDYETYRRFEFWRTLAEWGWVILFMLIPALLSLIPHPQEIVSLPDAGLVEERSNAT
jgi:hypothetical protein